VGNDRLPLQWRPPRPGGAPADPCTTDLAPRRWQKFKARPGQKFTWTNTSLADKKVAQTGTAVADRWGLVTAERAMVSKGRHRLIIRPGT
jgi:hypothetical protein